MIRCSACETALPVEAFVADGFVPCTGCGAPLQVDVFPRLFRGVDEGRPPERVLGDDEASCFYHPDNQAEVPCDGCGRYLCTVCDLEVDGRHLCTTCVDSGHGLATTDRLVRERTLWGSIILSLSILPLMIFYFTVVTAPLTLVLAIVHRKTPGSLVRPRRISFFLGVLFASLQIAGWVTLFVMLIVGLMGS
jgi:hypothetical protein